MVLQHKEKVICLSTHWLYEYKYSKYSGTVYLQSLGTLGFYMGFVNKSYLSTGEVSSYEHI